MGGMRCALSMLLGSIPPPSSKRQMRAVVILDHTKWDGDRAAMVLLLQHIMTSTRLIRLLLVLDEPLGRMGIVCDGVNETVVRVEPLTDYESAKLFVRKASRKVEPAEVEVHANCEVIQQLSHHSLITQLKGHAGNIV